MKASSAMRRTALLAAVAAAASCFGEMDNASSATVTFSLNTYFPAAVETSTVDFYCADGDTVTATPPGGTAVGVSTAGTVDGTVAFTPTEGGLWTITSSSQGTTNITVRHSLFGTLGAGTAESPAKVVDRDELVDLVSAGTAADGYVFALSSYDGLFYDLVNPSGFRLENVSDGVWRMVASEGGVVNLDEETFKLDTLLEGPDRKVKEKTQLVSYSGDAWAMGASAGSTLTFTSPEGEVVASYELTGTDMQTFKFESTGIWTVTLTPADTTSYETLTAQINVITGTMIYFR